MPWATCVRVAIAVICNAHQEILITQRSEKSTQAGLWEFPGGKLEEGELASDALIREIKEEVGLDVLSCSHWGDVQASLSPECAAKSPGNKTLTLHVYFVDAYQGEARCCEGQTGLRWVSASCMPDYVFPAANQEVLSLVASYFSLIPSVLSVS